MISNPEYIGLAFGSLFAILSPFATVPTFLALTEDQTSEAQTSMARRACLLACLVLVLFSGLGQHILAGFRVSVPALQIAGGLVILRVALELISGERRRLTPPERAEAESKDDIAITPLAIPILCGPGTITTGIILGTEAGDAFQHTLLVGIIAILYATTFGLLLLAIRSSTWMGPLTVRVIGRLMGMLLAAVAVQFILNGLQDGLLEPWLRP